jgi:hypothetical protein
MLLPERHYRASAQITVLHLSTFDRTHCVGLVHGRIVVVYVTWSAPNL